ncbi:hypothetical protein CCACVL1_08234, partial [Corchorus capsularis]
NEISQLQNVHPVLQENPENLEL